MFNVVYVKRDGYFSKMDHGLIGVIGVIVMSPVGLDYACVWEIATAHFRHMTETTVVEIMKKQHYACLMNVPVNIKACCIDIINQKR